MLRTPFLFLGFCISILVSAQSTDAVSTLTGGSSQQWTVIGNATTPKCNPGDATYTFQAKPAQVVVGNCVNGAWKNTTETLDTWSAGGGKNGIAFGGARYEVKSLPPSAPACKGNANCVRLTTVPDGKTDATRSIYLTH
jgi:hypothetical protein